MRWVSTRVLPEPAPAMTSSGPSGWVTASSWTGFSPSSSGSSLLGEQRPAGPSASVIGPTLPTPCDGHGAAAALVSRRGSAPPTDRRVEEADLGRTLLLAARPRSRRRPGCRRARAARRRPPSRGTSDIVSERPDARAAGPDHRGCGPPRRGRRGCRARAAAPSRAGGARRMRISSPGADASSSTTSRPGAGHLRRPSPATVTTPVADRRPCRTSSASTLDRRPRGEPLQLGDPVHVAGRPDSAPPGASIVHEQRAQRLALRRPAGRRSPGRRRRRRG